jgi:hypothetical protein
MSVQQLALHEALEERATELARMYIGALIVLSNPDNPDRLPQAAHSLRELMEKIPRYLAVETRASRGNLKDEARKLEERWNNTVENSACYDDGNWNGSIDRHLQRLLQRLQQFFDWFDEHHPLRRTETATVLRQLDGSGRTLPARLEDQEVKGWLAIRDYFVSVSHHRTPPPEEDFRARMDALERFLLDRLRPRTFADFDVIDDIIQEGEGDA